MTHSLGTAVIMPSQCLESSFRLHIEPRAGSNHWRFLQEEPSARPLFPPEPFLQPDAGEAEKDGRALGAGSDGASYGSLLRPLSLAVRCFISAPFPPLLPPTGRRASNQAWLGRLPRSPRRSPLAAAAAPGPPAVAPRAALLQQRLGARRAAEEERGGRGSSEPSDVAPHPPLLLPHPCLFRPGVQHPRVHSGGQAGEVPCTTPKELLPCWTYCTKAAEAEEVGFKWLSQNRMGKFKGNSLSRTMY